MKKYFNKVFHSDLIFNALIFLVAFGLPFYFNFVFIMNHFYYEGAYLLDSGWFSKLLWGNDLSLKNPIQLGGQYWDTHFSPIFVLMSYFSQLLPLNHVSYFAVFQGVSFGLLGYWPIHFLRHILPVQPKNYVLAIAVLSGLCAMTGIAKDIALYPHFEGLIPITALYFFSHFYLEKIKWAVFWFVLCLILREDAGLHLTAILGTLVFCTLVFHRDYWQKHKSLVVFAAIAFVYAGCVVYIKKKFFAQDDAFSRIYLGDPAFGHLNGQLLLDRLSTFFDEKRFIWVPACFALFWSARTKNIFWFCAVLACFPWLLINLIAYSDAAGHLSLYYAFPLILAQYFPLIVVSFQRQSTNQQLVLLYLFVLFFSGLNLGILPLSLLTLGFVAIVLLGFHVLWLDKKQSVQRCEDSCVGSNLIIPYAFLVVLSVGCFLKSFQNMNPMMVQLNTKLWASTQEIMRVIDQRLSLLGQIYLDPGAASLTVKASQSPQFVLPRVPDKMEAMDSFLFFKSGWHLAETKKILSAFNAQYACRFSGSNLVLASTIKVHEVFSSQNCSHPYTPLFALLETAEGVDFYEGNYWIRKNTQGIALYGPFIPLAKGQYRLDYDFFVLSDWESTSSLRVDVVDQRGQKLISDQRFDFKELKALNQQGLHRASLIFTVGEPLSEAEFRLWLERNPLMKLANLSLTKLS